MYCPYCENILFKQPFIPSSPFCLALSSDHPEEEAIRYADRVRLCLASTSVPDPVQRAAVSVSASDLVAGPAGPPQEPILPVGEFSASLTLKALPQK